MTDRAAAGNARRTPDRPPDLAERKALERLLAELPDAEAVPRQEGELSFNSPWELRALGVAVGLHREGRFPWPEFQQALVDAIREWEAEPAGTRGEWSYYRLWLRALERMVVERGLASAAEIDGKTVECVREAEHTRAHQHAGLLTVEPAGETGGH